MLFNILLIFLLQLTNSFTCFGNERKYLKYKNSDNLITNLPSIRILTPGYSSQFAVNYLSHLFVNELIGLNTTFFPFEDEPQFLSDWNAIERRKCTKEELDNNDENCFRYPSYYFEILKNDDIDLQMEYWASHELESNATENYYIPGIAERATIGTYGEVGLFIPKYLVQDNPVIELPSLISMNNTLREFFYNGSLGIDGGYNTPNWLKYFSDDNNIVKSSTFGYRWSYPNETFGTQHPMFAWGSVEDYYMSEYYYNFLQKNNISFITVGSESFLKEMVVDMYNDRVPFIANIYVPDDNFANLDINGNFLDFEKLKLPFNKAQAVETECVDNFDCEYPIDPINKMINPKIVEKIPEIRIFFETFELNAEQISLIMSYYNQIRTEDITEHEKWLNASCSWLKTPGTKNFWGSWLVDIKRFECINGCGLTGICDENVGKCNCDEDFFGDNCEFSCPGIITENNNISFCNNNGVCNRENAYKCECFNEFTGEDCGKRLEELIINRYFEIIFIVIFSLLTLFIIFILYKSEDKYPIIILLGNIFLSISSVLLLIEATKAICNLNILFYNLGRFFFLGMFTNYICNVYNQESNIFIIIGTFIIEIILTVFYIVENDGIEVIFDKENLVIENTCYSDFTYDVLNITYSVILFLTIIYYAYLTRKFVLDNYSEYLLSISTCYYISSILLFFTFVITNIFIYTFDSYFFYIIVFNIESIIILFTINMMYYKYNIINKYEDNSGGGVNEFV